MFALIALLAAMTLFALGLAYNQSELIREYFTAMVNARK
jgi:hypothetical protein